MLLTESHMEAEKTESCFLSAPFVSCHLIITKVYWADLNFWPILLADTLSNHINWSFYSGLSSSLVKWVCSFKLNAQLPLGLFALWHLLLLTEALTRRTVWHRQYVSAHRPSVTRSLPPVKQPLQETGQRNSELLRPVVQCLDLAWPPCPSKRQSDVPRVLKLAVN